MQCKTSFSLVADTAPMTQIFVQVSDCTATTIQAPPKYFLQRRTRASVVVSEASVAARWSASSRPHSFTSFFVSARLRCASCRRPTPALSMCA